MATQDIKDMIYIREFNPLNCSKDVWKTYHAFRKKRHIEVHANENFVDDELEEKNLRLYKKNPEIEGVLFQIRERETQLQVGVIICVLPRKATDMYKENSHYMEFYLIILTNYRRRGIGTYALTKVLELAEQHKKTVLATDTYENDGKSFLQTIGAELEVCTERRANMDEMDWNMVERWVQDATLKSPETTLKFYEAVPDEILDEYSKLYTETYNQQPLECLDNASIIFSPKYLRHKQKEDHELGNKRLIFITTEKDGQISGLTVTHYNPHNESTITQDLTGVKEEHRGRGLGKWLKGAMLLKIRKQFPEAKTMSTENATTNAPMLSINERLGFKFYREAIEAQISRDKLAEYLAKAKP